MIEQTGRRHGPQRRLTQRRLTQRWTTPLAAILLAGAAVFAWERFAAPAPESAPAAGGEIYYGPANSLAVLPFADRSPAGDQESQALGFAGELLERFVDVPDLQVAARRSAFFFRDEATPPRVIAERLQSAYLLRGGWRNDDGRLTVTASLYDARRDREFWRKDYAGRLAELPALRDAVVDDALQAIPGLGSQGPAATAGVRPEAWLSLQQGLYLADPLSRSPPGLPGDPDLPAARAALQSALELEPGYEAAQLSLAELLLHPAWTADAAAANPTADRVEQARRLAEAVLRGNPGSARAWGLLSDIRYRHDWDWQGASQAGRQAAAARPGDAALLATAGLALFTLAEFGEARELLEASIRRDPLNLGSRLQLGLLLEYSGAYDEALATYRQVLALHPQYPAVRACRARVKVLQGKPESALRESGQEADPFWRRYAEILALAAAERAPEARPLLEQMISDDGARAAFQLAELFAFEGRVEAAFEWLERARQQRDPGLSALLGNPLLSALRDDPRWPTLLASLGLPLDSPR